MNGNIVAQLMVVSAMTIGIAQTAQADEPSRDPASSTKAMPIDSSPSESDQPTLGLLGDWGGLKKSMANRGIELGLFYKGDLASNMSGGVQRKTVFFGNVDVTADFDFNQLFGAEGWSLSLYGLGNHGPNPSEEFIGDALVVSNIEATNTFKLYEAYLKKSFGESTSVLFGLRDLNADFYSNEPAKGLINSSFGISKSLSQTGVNGPSIFPYTALALSAKHQTSSGIYVQGAIFNATAGDPDHLMGTHIRTDHDNGYLMIAEVGQQKGDSGKMGLGVWAYNDYKNVSNDIHPNGGQERNHGVYLIYDQKISESLSLFARYGSALDKTNLFSRAIELGTSLSAPFTSRSQDQINFGVAKAVASNAYKDSTPVENAEYAFELNYKYQVMDGFMLTPDVQYIVNPGLSETVKDATVGILRIELDF